MLPGVKNEIKLLHCRFYEKPKENETTSRNASVVFYCFRESTLPYIEKYVSISNVPIHLLCQGHLKIFS